MDELEGFFDRRLKLPVYYQIYLTIRDWIFSGSLGIGTQLPTEAELCENFGVSRITIRKAVDLLEREGLLSREQGRGTFVTEKAADAPFTGDMGQLLRRLESIGNRTEIADVDIEEIDADEEVRADLKLGEGARVVRVAHLRLTRGKKTGYITSYVPSDLGLSFSTSEIASKASMLTLLEDKGVKLHSADHLIGATLADLRYARHLDIDVGSPLVRMRVVANDRDYRPVELMIACYRADYYQYHLHLVREPGKAGEPLWAQKQTPEGADQN